MNSTKNTPFPPLPATGLLAHSLALEAAGLAISLVTRVPGRLKSLADQVIRSASSVPANLAEGQGRKGRDRMHHWRIAYGSAREVDSHLRLLLHAGAVDPNGATRALELFDRVRALTWRLLYPRRWPWPWPWPWPGAVAGSRDRDRGAGHCALTPFPAAGDCRCPLPLSLPLPLPLRLGVHQPPEPHPV